MAHQEHPIWSKVGLFFVLVGVVSYLAALLILGSQAWVWLKLGEWPPLSVAAVLYGLGIPEPHPVQSLIGLQKIIDFTISVLDWPASLAFFLLGGLFLIIGERAGHYAFKKGRNKHS
jgi:hypothetical protein